MQIPNRNMNQTTLCAKYVDRISINLDCKIPPITITVKIFIALPIFFNLFSCVCFDIFTDVQKSFFVPTAKQFTWHFTILSLLQMQSFYNATRLLIKGDKHTKAHTWKCSLYQWIVFVLWNNFSATVKKRNDWDTKRNQHRNIICCWEVFTINL